MECDSAQQQLKEICEGIQVMEDNTQERTMNPEATIVLDVTQLSKLRHE
jgi:hypothetical protein